jgi:hypothetical protein
MLCMLFVFLFVFACVVFMRFIRMFVCAVLRRFPRFFEVLGQSLLDVTVLTDTNPILGWFCSFQGLRVYPKFLSPFSASAGGRFGG